MDIIVGNSLDVAVSHLLVPDLEGLGAAQNKTPATKGREAYPMLYRIDRNPDYNKELVLLGSSRKGLLEKCF